MDCPFCAEEIKDEAVVCIHCHRDLSIPRPLLEKLKHVTERMAALEEEVARLAAIAAAPPPVYEPEHDSEHESEHAHAPRRRRSPAAALAGEGIVVATVAALLLAHYIVVILFDAHLVWLRGTSIVVPILAGAIYNGTRDASFARTVAAALFMAAVSVGGMNVDLHLAFPDNPILPSGAADWRETLEYVASVFLSFSTGVLIARLVKQRNLPAHGRPDKSAALIHKVSLGIADKAHLGKSGELEIEKLLKSLESVSGSVIAIGAAIGSVITGLSHIF